MNSFSFQSQDAEARLAPTKLETSHPEDTGAGDHSNPIRRSGRQRRPSARHPRPHTTPTLARPAPASPVKNIPPEELVSKLNLEELVCSCGEALASRAEYVEHVLTHVAGAFRCPQCSCAYTCSSRLARHQRLLHTRGDAPGDALPHGSPVAAPDDGAEERCYLCEDAVSGGDEELREHLRVHLCGENECPVCALRLDTSYAMEMHVQRKHPSLLHTFLKGEDSLKDESSRSEDSGGLPVRCDVCGKVVATPSRLARHRYLQHPEHYPWPCPACTLAFPSLHARDHHVCPHRRKGGKATPGHGKKNECLVCNTAFKSRVSLECHMRRAHPTEAAGPHACPVCGRSLSSRKALTDHLRCHRREGFACEFCGAKLKTLDSLNVHINEIHTHVVRLQCRLCSQVFFSSGRLSYHMKRHHTDRRSYTNLCHLCGKAYPYPSELKLHLRSHRNERPYKCDQCQKTFLKQGDLTYHKRSHTGERPHKCPHCDARFPRPNTLMSHIRQQHRDTAAVAAATATATTAVNTAAISVNTAATATNAAPTAIATEAAVTTAAAASYVSSAPATVAPPSASAYLPAAVSSAPPAVSLQHQRPPAAVTVMGVGREGGEATLVPVVEGRLVEGQLVEAVVEGQMTEMQPVQYVQVDGLSAGQTVQAVQAVQAVPHMVEGMEYDEAGNVPYQIVHLQILQ